MKRTLSLILSFAFFVGTFSGVISAEAKSTSQLRSEKQKIQQQIDSAQSKLNKLSAEKKKNQEYLEALRSKINLLQDSILQTRVAKMFFLSDETSIFVPILQ